MNDPPPIKGSSESPFLPNRVYSGELINKAKSLWGARRYVKLEGSDREIKIVKQCAPGERRQDQTLRSRAYMWLTGSQRISIRVNEEGKEPEIVEMYVQKKTLKKVLKNLGDQPSKPTKTDESADRDAILAKRETQIAQPVQRWTSSRPTKTDEPPSGNKIGMYRRTVPTDYQDVLSEDSLKMLNSNGQVDEKSILEQFQQDISNRIGVYKEGLDWMGLDLSYSGPCDPSQMREHLDTVERRMNTAVLNYLEAHDFEIDANDPGRVILWMDCIAQDKAIYAETNLGPKLQELGWTQEQIQRDVLAEGNVEHFGVIFNFMAINASEQRGAAYRDLLSTSSGKTLKECGASFFANAIDLEDEDGRTQLAVQCLLGNREGVEMLLLLGANINGSDSAGSTPLALACEEGKVEIIELLLERGARADTMDNAALTPYLHALNNPNVRNTSVCERLKELDKGYSEEITKCKELAHRFSIPDETVSILGEEMRLEGWTVSQARLTLHVAIKSFYDKLLGSHEAGSGGSWMSMLQRIPKGLPNAKQCAESLNMSELEGLFTRTQQAVAESTCDVSQAQERLAKGETVGLMLLLAKDKESPTEHCVTMTVAQVGDAWEVCLANKGAGNGNQPGIRIFRTSKNPFDDLASFYPTSTYEFFLTGIVAKLELQQIQYIPQTRQKSGNCTVANSNGMELAILYQELKRLRPDQPHEVIIAVAQAIKKERCADSRVGTLKAYFDFHDQPGAPPRHNRLLKKISSKLSTKPLEKLSDEETDSMYLLLAKLEE